MIQAASTTYSLKIHCTSQTDPNAISLHSIGLARQHSGAAPPMALAVFNIIIEMCFVSVVRVNINEPYGTTFEATSHTSQPGPGQWHIEHTWLAPSQLSYSTMAPLNMPSATPPIIITKHPQLLRGI